MKKSSKGPTSVNKEGSPFQWSNNPFNVLANQDEDISKENLEPTNSLTTNGLGVVEEDMSIVQDVDSMDEVVEGPQGQHMSTVSQ